MKGKAGDRTVVLIPAFNAAKTINRVVKKIDRKIADGIIVVNDGSSDNTGAVLKKIKGIKAVSHSKNQGYGATSITLYKEGLKDNFDFFVTIHSDLGHNPAEIEKMIQPLKNGSADVVLGDRVKGILEKAPTFLRSKLLGGILRGPMPSHKFLANIILSNFQKFCYGTKVASFHSGFRACNRKTLRLIPFDKLTSWYQYDTEFLIKANENKLRIMEVPITSYYSKDAGSGVPAVKYGLKEFSSAIGYFFNKRL